LASILFLSTRYDCWEYNIIDYSQTDHFGMASIGG